MQPFITRIFNEHIETASRCIEPMTPLIVETSKMLVQALLNDNKILCCANGSSISASQQFASHLLNQFRQERPSLPAISLSNDSTTITSIAAHGSFNEIYSRQIRALGHKGDILLAVSSTGNESNLVHAIKASKDREMGLVILSGANGGDMASLLAPEDIELRVPAINPSRIQEMHLLIAHCLCELIDYQLFGAEV